VQEKDGQWSFTPYVIVELADIPQVSSDVVEIITFDKNSIPDDFGWWTKEELREFIEEHKLS
ncbi:hypothetical protein IID24_00380, partial [Patescibacteria group bacterium]|nr:hypothetical protein [Patescibacteria group bacterium]